MENPPSSVEAIEKIAAPLLKLTTWAAVIFGIAWFVGWRYMLGMLQHFHADWLVDSITPVQFAELALRKFWWIAPVYFCFLAWHSKGTDREQVKFFVFVFIAVTALASLGIHVVLGFLLPPDKVSYWGWIGGNLFAVSIAQYAAFMTLAVIDDERRIPGVQFFLFGVLGIVAGPFFITEYASAEFGIGLTALTYVRAYVDTSDSGACGYLVVSSLGGGRILASNNGRAYVVLPLEGTKFSSRRPDRCDAKAIKH